MGNNNTQNMMTSNKTRLIVSIADLIISEGISFNISHKPRFNKVLYLSRTVSKCYQAPNRKLIYKVLLDVIHDQNTEKSLSLIEKESDILDCYFVGDGATIPRIPLLNSLVSGKTLQQLYYNLLIARTTFKMAGKRMEPLYVIDLLRT